MQQTLPGFGTPAEPTIVGAATYDGPDDCYRYSLSRTWGPGPRVLFVMLNPSTATAEVLDPTVTRCLKYAERHGYDGLDVANLFALRSTDPRKLDKHPEPVGAGNDGAITLLASRASLIVAAWGADKAIGNRAAEVLAMLQARYVVHCLGVTQGGHPRHPLYMPNTAIAKPLVEAIAHRWKVCLP